MDITKMKQTLLTFTYLLIIFTGCEKKDEPKPTETSWQLFVADKNAWITINGVQEDNNGQTIILSKGDKVEVESNGVDTWEPISGSKTEGQVHTDIYINGRSVYSNHCHCDSYWTKTF